MAAIFAYELQVGEEFSFDEGANWWVCRSNLDANDNDDTIIMYAPIGSTGIGCWKELRIDGYTKVITEPNENELKSHHSFAIYQKENCYEERSRPSPKTCRG